FEREDAAVVRIAELALEIPGNAAEMALRRGGIDAPLQQAHHQNRVREARPALHAALQWRPDVDANARIPGGEAAPVVCRAKDLRQADVGVGRHDADDRA